MERGIGRPQWCIFADITFVRGRCQIINQAGLMLGRGRDDFFRLGPGLCRARIKNGFFSTEGPVACEKIHISRASPVLRTSKSARPRQFCIKSNSSYPGPNPTIPLSTMLIKRSPPPSRSRGNPYLERQAGRGRLNRTRRILIILHRVSSPL